MFNFIHFKKLPEQNHQKPANEIIKQQKTPEDHTASPYIPSNQPRTNEQQKMTHLLCNQLKKQQIYNKRMYKKNKQIIIRPKEKHNYK